MSRIRARDHLFTKGAPPLSTKRRSYQRRDAATHDPRRSRRHVGDDAKIGPLALLFVDSLPTMTSGRGRLYAPKTVQKHADSLRLLVRDLGDQPVASLSRGLVRDWLLRQRQAGRTLHTVQTRETSARSFCNWLVARGILEESPMDGLQGTRVRDTPIITITDADAGRMLVACDRQTWVGARDRAIISTLWRCGLRASELCGLHLSDYYEEGREAFLRVAGSKSDAAWRIIGVPRETRLLIDDWVVAWRGDAPGFLFMSERGGMLRRDSLHHELKKIGTRAKVQRIHPHNWRHTYALNYLRSGGEMYTLSRLLGHSSIHMTTKYVRAMLAEEAAMTNITVRGGRRA